MKPGDTLEGGMVFATCPETELILHKSMVPPGEGGTVLSVVPNGSYTVEDVLVTYEDRRGDTTELKLAQRWPIRTARPVLERLASSVPLITGQRIVDTMFPIAKGGTAAIPGGFGTGKTMTQHQLAKWCDADIIVYIGCGERGNEMTQVLEEFGELIDPKSCLLYTSIRLICRNFHLIVGIADRLRRRRPLRLLLRCAGRKVAERPGQIVFEAHADCSFLSRELFRYRSAKPCGTFIASMIAHFL